MSVYRNIDREQLQFDFLLNSTSEGVYTNEIQQMGGRVYSVPSRKKGILKNKKVLKEFFKEHQEYNIIHQHVSSLTNIEPIKAAKRAKIPIRIIHSRNNMQNGFIHNILHRINKIKIDQYATDYFGISKLAINWLYKRKMIKENKCKIIPNGIQIDNFLFSKEKRLKIRKELNIEDKIVIGNVAKFLEQKNHKFLVKLFYELSKTHNDVILLLLGTGKLEDKIKQKVKKLNIEDKVIFLGVKKNANDYMNAMDVFVCPSLYEGFGRVLIEAQTCDLPCVATSNTIPEEVKILDTFQFISLKENKNKWIDAIEKVLNYKERVDRKKDIQEAGYDIEQIAKKLQNYYLSR